MKWAAAPTRANRENGCVQGSSSRHAEQCGIRVGSDGQGGALSHKAGTAGPHENRRRAEHASRDYGKSVTLGVRRTFGVVAPPVLLMTFEISPLGPMQTVIKSWNLTLGLWGASKARGSTTPLLRNTL